MTKYDVTIRATVTKTYTIVAASEAEAEATAYDIFTVESDDTPEKYEQELVQVMKTGDQP